MSLIAAYGMGADDVNAGEGLAPGWGYGSGTGLVVSAFREIIELVVCIQRAWRVDVER